MNLGDPRRNRRVIRLIGHLSAKPTASVPQACGDWADTMAAYRFFGNEEVQWEGILAPHIERSVSRMAAHPVVLCIQDTTELDFNGQQAKGLGPLSYEAQRGMYVHPTYAVSTLREPLGVLDAWECGRARAQGRRWPAPRRQGARALGRRLAKRLAEMAGQLPHTRLVYLADREADIMDLMVCARDLDTPVDWLLRSRHNRTLSEGGKLWSRVTDTEPLGEIRFTMASRQGQRAREVVQEVWAQALQLPDGKGGFVQASCIVAKEAQPAAGDKPARWRLLTNSPVQSLEQAAQMIDWRRARWETRDVLSCAQEWLPY